MQSSDGTPAVVTQTRIKELAEFRSHDAPVVSCYLDIDGRRQIRKQDYVLRFESMAKECEASHANAKNDLRRIYEYVSNGIDRSRTRGLAVFSCAEKGLWEVVSLPVPVANRVAVNHSPVISPLEAVVNELESLAVLMVDKQRAKLLLLEMGQIVERVELFEALPRANEHKGHAEKGRREREQHHLDELTHHHLRHATDAAFKLFQKTSFGYLTIGATDEMYAATESLLHPYLRKALGPRIHATAHSSDTEILAAAFAVEHEIEQQIEKQHVEKLREAAGAKRRAVLGLSDAIKAIYEKRVSMLLVSDGFSESGWICSCGAMALRGPRCPIDGQDMERTDDVVSNAVDAALAEGARLLICNGNADLDVMGRIGAFCRY